MKEDCCRSSTPVSRGLDQGIAGGLLSLNIPCTVASCLLLSIVLPSFAEGLPVATERDVAYGDHPEQRLDVYWPRGVADAPVMIFVHGGGWRRGDKSGNTIPDKVDFFTGRGWVFVSINYRLLPDGEHPRNVEDVACATAWVHDHISESGGDPDKLFLMGHSAGAHLVSLVATDERRLKAFGKPLSVVRGVIALDTNAYDLSQASQFHQGVFGDDPPVWRDASPLTHVASGKSIPPFLIFYSRGMGENTNPSRPAQAKAFANELRQAGIAAEVVDATDRNHGEINRWFGRADDRKVTGAAVQFLDGILGQEEDADATQRESWSTALTNRLIFEKDFFPGTRDAEGMLLAGTETMNFAVHDSKVFAGLGNRNIPTSAPIRVGAQVIVKESAHASWRVDQQFPSTAPRVNALISAQFTTDADGNSLEQPVSILVAAPSDESTVEDDETGGAALRWATAWTRDDSSSIWSETQVYSADRRKPACRAFVTYQDPTTKICSLFAGTSHGSIYRAVYDPTAPGRLSWNISAELENTGRVVAFAECNGILYAACGLRRTRANGVMGGLYQRLNGPRPAWECVYRWPWPQRRGGADEALLMRGLTAVEAADGMGQVLLGSRAQVGVIERIDPSSDHRVTVDFNIRDHFAKLWDLPLYRGAALSAYNRMVPWTDPQTGERVHLIGLAVLHPTLNSTPPHNGAWYLVRNSAGSYATGYVHDSAHPLAQGENLRGVRAIVPSPFGDGAIYMGGGDIGKQTSWNTAWIYRGMTIAEEPVQGSVPDRGH